MSKPRVCVDFDGTIWDGAILPGCVEALTKIQEHYAIAIFSARSTDAERKQMKDILDSNSVPYDEILPSKPMAVAYIDDRGIGFRDWRMVSLAPNRYPH